MAVDSQGIVYVTDPHYSYIQKFSISGQFIGNFGNMGKKEGELSIPFGIAIDDQDYVHISELPLQRILIFTSKGKLVRCFQARDKDRESDRKVKVFALAIDKSGNLYACNLGNCQVVMF